MTNPNDAIGTNAAYGSRTSVNAFGDFIQLINGRGVLSGWAAKPTGGMSIEFGGDAGIRDVAVAEDNLGNRTTINNRLSGAVAVSIAAASASSDRYDAVVAYVNNPAQAADETPDAPSVCGIIVAQGNSSGVTEQQIRSAITADGGTGSVAYYVVLAIVFVAANTTVITSGNITQSHVSLSASDIADGEITSSMIDWSSIISGTTSGINIAANNYVSVTVTLPRTISDYTVVYSSNYGGAGWTNLLHHARNKTSTSFQIEGTNRGGETLTGVTFDYLVIPRS